MIAKTGRESLDQLLEIVKPLLLKVGISEKQIRIRKGKHHIDILSNAYDWLHELFCSVEYREAQKIRKLCSEKVWEHYDLMEITGLQEQKLWLRAKVALYRRWHQNRPSIFNPDKKRKHAHTKKTN